MDISRIFKSKTRKELFKLYFTNPENEYYLRELERLLDIPVSMIRKELIRLEEESIFTSHKRGNLTYFRLNKSYPLFGELKSIVFKTVGAEGRLRQIVKELQGIKTAFIYGSFAKNEEKAGSDIDLVIIGDADDDSLLVKIRKAEENLKREINYTAYSAKEFEKERKKQGGFLDLVLKDKIVMLKGNINA
ncbi:MAG: nucleotidyltransferase domain-containing protein [Candidatus Omnitrophica bacterium]|nr:nucleotidyltransferase domain-containing protein [Candidatus Omnitrophota bacterium]MBU4488484.1 nucleotidyltransferase domain-containing protein [Candidatus Omnitrophota bacterium]MCG2704604.1 nucleotidyltransferase domain-containing protein [Candidatus Omnitrophota bacterium]